MGVKQELGVSVLALVISFFLLPPVNRTFSLFMCVSALASTKGCRFVVAGEFQKARRVAEGWEGCDGQQQGSRILRTMP
jgi:hypothetical protein